MSKFKINCKNVYDTGDKYLNSMEKIIDAQEELDKAGIEISQIWTDAAGHNFITSLNNHIYELNTVIDFLETNGNLLKSLAQEHSNIDNTMTEKIERSGIDEYDEV